MLDRQAGGRNNEDRLRFKVQGDIQLGFPERYDWVTWHTRYCANPESLNYDRHHEISFCLSTGICLHLSVCLSVYLESVYLSICLRVERCFFHQTKYQNPKPKTEQQRTTNNFHDTIQVHSIISHEHQYSTKERSYNSSFSISILP